MIVVDSFFKVLDRIFKLQILTLIFESGGIKGGRDLLGLEGRGTGGRLWGTGSDDFGLLHVKPQLIKLAIHKIHDDAKRGEGEDADEGNHGGDNLKLVTVLQDELVPHFASTCGND